MIFLTKASAKVDNLIKTVTKAHMFLRRKTPECCVLLSNPMCWDFETGRRSSLDDLIASQEGCQRKQMRSCRQAAGCRGWHESHSKVHSSQLQAKGSHRRRSLANVERLRKDDAQLLEFWTVAVDPS